MMMVFLGAVSVSNGQVYWASLSGPAEQPPNTSPGTGKALVTIDVAANTMRVQATFSGLLAGVTASHIHAATAVPGAGTAGVATTLPTFPGFPSGVTAGTYDRTFDMTQASSYSAAYITNNGGTPASAFLALRNAIAAGRAYLNIHSTMFPPGEIRGFLLPCPPLNVAIPDAFALPSGTLANTVYPAYAPASSLTLQSNVSGGAGPYSLTWSNGATTPSITVSPAATTTYTLNVQDANGCPGSASKTVNVVDISGGNNGNKIVVCHNGHSITIAAAAVASHLAHGDMLGSCDPAGRVRPIETEGLRVKVMSNPSPNYFELQIRSNANENIRLSVFDNLGRLIENKSLAASDQTVRFGSSYNSGIYLVEIVQGLDRQTFKLVKTK